MLEKAGKGLILLHWPGVEVDRLEVRDCLAKLGKVVKHDRAASAGHPLFSQSNPLEEANELTLDIVDGEANVLIFNRHFLAGRLCLGNSANQGCVVHTDVSCPPRLQYVVTRC